MQFMHLIEVNWANQAETRVWHGNFEWNIFQHFFQHFSLSLDIFQHFSEKSTIFQQFSLELCYFSRVFFRNLAFFNGFLDNSMVFYHFRRVL